jgi:hypothetical protein
MNHTEDCTGGLECEPIEGVWDQPPGIYAQMAQEQFGDMPWCQIRRVAFVLEGAHASRTRPADEYVVLRGTRLWIVLVAQEVAVYDYELGALVGVHDDGSIETDRTLADPTFFETRAEAEEAASRVPRSPNVTLYMAQVDTKPFEWVS